MVEIISEKTSFLVKCLNPSGTLMEASIELSEEIANLLTHASSDLAANFEALSISEETKVTQRIFNLVPLH